MRTPKQAAEFIIDGYMSKGYSREQSVAEAHMDVASYAYGMYDIGDAGREYWVKVQSELTSLHRSVRNGRR